MKSLKEDAIEWINFLFQQYSINDKETATRISFDFKIRGFEDEPEVYIQPTLKGLEFGYIGTKWDGYLPSPIPGMYKKHVLKWENLQSMRGEEQQEAILELLIKTINSRKRQYRECQFCKEKVAEEHRFDKDTCHGCTSTHFGVVY